MADKIKLLLAVLLVIGGIAGYYFFADAPMIVRVLSVLAGLALGVAAACLSLRLHQEAGSRRCAAGAIDRSGKPPATPNQPMNN